MFKIDHIPILGASVEASETYLRKSSEIVRHPIQFCEALELLEPREFNESVKYCSIGIVVGFLTLVPFFWLHEGEASKSIYVLKQFLQIMVHSVILHYCLVLLGSKRKRIVFTVIPQFYIAGLLSPIMYMILIPLLLKIGPEAVIRLQLGETSQISLTLYENLYVVGSAWVVIGMTYFLMFMWHPRIHEITKKRFLAGLLIAGIPANLFYFLALHPFLEYTEGVLGAFNMAL